MLVIRPRLRLNLPRTGAATLAALLAAAVVLTGSAAAAPAPKPAPKVTPPLVTFGIGPGTATGPDVHRSDLNYNVDPGANTLDHVAVFNFDPKPQVLNLYTVDAFNNASGSIAFDPRSTPGTDAHTWLSVQAPGGLSTITVPPAVRGKGPGVLVLPVLVHVPMTATPGDHLAAVIVSIISKATSPGRTNVNFEQRVALRAFFHINGTLVPQLSVIDLNATYHDNWNPFGAGSATVSYRVKNTGNVVLGGKEKLTITGLFGSSGSMKAIADVPPLLVGGSFPVTVQVHDVWPEVFMHAAVTVTPESLIGSVNPPLHLAHGETSFFAIPWALIILIVVLLGGGYALRRWLKKRRAGAPARHRPPGGKKPAMAETESDVATAGSDMAGAGSDHVS